MSMSDPIADMLTRIRNGQLSEKTFVTFPGSKHKAAICKVLEAEGYIGSTSLESEGEKPIIKIGLKYYHGSPVIEMLKRVSTPGLRVYRGADELPDVIGGLGAAIVSTSQGVMSGKKAKSLGLGGEVICLVA
jgi:small subunit ribosomal protein S8